MEIPIFNNDEQIMSNLESILGENGENFIKNERYYFSLGARGIYREEIGKRFLRNSTSCTEGCDEYQLPGTCAIRIEGDPGYGVIDMLSESLQYALELSKDYGNTEYIAIVIGDDLGMDVEANDPSEIVLGDAEVIAYIKKDTI